MQSMTEEFLQKKPVSHDCDAGGGNKSKVGQGVTLLQEALLEKGRSPNDEPACVSAGDGIKRARTPRALTNVSTLG